MRGPQTERQRISASDLDEDALTGAFLGGLDGGFFLSGGNRGHCFGAGGVAEDLVAVLDVGQAIVEECEDVGSDLLAETVAGAQILVNPDLHVAVALPAGACLSMSLHPTGSRN